MHAYIHADHSKPNQDAFSHTSNFASQVSDAFFAVYDGHGRDGEKCAQYSRDMLPTVLSRVVKEMKLELCHEESDKGVVPMFTDVELGKEQVQHACTKSHLIVNAGLRENGDIDDTLSGTTAVSVFVQGRLNRITISNVGDSRAILGRRVWKEGEVTRSVQGRSAVPYKAIPLSRDQTPHSKVERKRIRACGARILSLDQIEGLEPVKLYKKDDDENDENGHDNHDSEKEEGEEDFDENDDPPRVWHPTMDYPGTAFTRSLGDALAKELGVIAEPEMVTMELQEGDEIIVLATDGVFEFLTNQSVIDICAKFKDPLEACRAVISEAYQLWLQYELRTDDITMICIFMDGIGKKDAQKNSSSHSSLHRATLDASDSISFETEHEAKDEDKVNRRSAEIKDMLKESLHQTPTKERSINMPFLKTEKTNEEKDVLNHAIQRSLILQKMSKKQLEMIYSAMQPISVKKGDWLICQGDVGNCLYIAEEGTFEARLVSPQGSNQHTEDKGGKLVHVYEASKQKKIFPCFGELSLLYSSPRAASIVARTDGKLWALHRVALKAIMKE